MKIHMIKSENSTQEKSKPIHEIRLGNIRAAIWENHSNFGSLFYKITFSMEYRRDSQQHSTASFDRDDLLLVAKVADRAHSWIFEQTKGPAGAPLSSLYDCR